MKAAAEMRSKKDIEDIVNAEDKRIADYKDALKADMDSKKQELGDLDGKLEIE